MSNNITNEWMPLNSHCIEEIELHTGTSQCFAKEYCIIENISYPIVVEYNDTSNIITFDYDNITFDDNYNEIHDRGSESVEVNFSENDGCIPIAHISFVEYNNVEIPYYFSQKGQGYNLIEYTAPSETYVNTNAFNPTHTFSNGNGKLEQEDCFTRIPDYAFYYSETGSFTPIPDEHTSNMTSITLPKTIRSIGKGAFTRSSLVSCNFSENSELTSIGFGAFYNCASLTSINIPNNVTEICDSAFYGCYNLTSIDIPNGVTSIGIAAFEKCSGLTSIDIPDSVTSIGNAAFNGCSGLTSCTIGSSVTSIGDSAFYQCSGLTSIVIPNSVTSIGDSAFYQCRSLTNINIPSSVTKIGYGAFEDCRNITSVIIPSGVTSIGGNAFYNCINLTHVTVNAVTPLELGGAAFDFASVSASYPIYVPEESVIAYKAASGWSTYASRIQAIP